MASQFFVNTLDDRMEDELTTLGYKPKAPTVGEAQLRTKCIAKLQY